MNNVKKLKLNTVTSLANQFVMTISGLILPRYILNYFGSDVNGLISSVLQFLSIISFLEMGMGSVIGSALYKPLASDSSKKISEVMVTGKKFYTNIARILIGYVIILILIFPYLIDSPYDFLGTSFLILAMSISTFAQYYFGIMNQILLSADQKSFIFVSVNIITIILNTLISIILVTQGFTIQVIRLTTSIIYLIRPIFLYFYVNKNYDIDYNVSPNQKSVPQMWNGIAQHIAYVLSSSTDMVVLTIFSSLENVSVYSIYNMVLNGIKLILSSLTSGLKSFFGNLLALKQIGKLNNYFSRIEWIIHVTVVYLFGMTAVLINNFVLIYTTGVDDANYYVPLFALLFTLSNAIYSLRIPYNSMVLAAGHFKQTQNSSIIEATINIVISVITVNKYGLVGVAIGTLIAMIFKIIYLVIYLSKNIVNRSVKIFLKYIMVDTLIFSMMLVISNVMNFYPTDFISWISTSIIYGFLFFLLVLIMNYIFYKDFTKFYISRFIDALKLNK